MLKNAFTEINSILGASTGECSVCVFVCERVCVSLEGVA